MYRKLKSEVLKDLSVKHEQELKIKNPDGDKYILVQVKNALQNYSQERAIYESKLSSINERIEFAKYRTQIETIRRLGPAADIMPMIIESNKVREGEDHPRTTSL